MANSTAGLMTIASSPLPLGELQPPISFGGDWGQCNYAGNYGGPGMITSCNGIIVPSRGDSIRHQPEPRPGLDRLGHRRDQQYGDVQRAPARRRQWPRRPARRLCLALRRRYRRWQSGALFQVSSVAPFPDQGAAGVAVALQLVAACKSIPGGTVPAEDSGTGYAWLYTQGYDTINISYSHVMTPNSYSCTGAESGFFGAQGNFTSDGSGGGWLAAINGDEQSPRRRQRLHGRRSREVHQGLGQLPGVVGAGVLAIGRGHQLRSY